MRNELEEFVNQIRPHILELLQEYGYDTSAPIRCLNPEHEDKTPSVLVSNAANNDWTIWCLGCGKRYDIFNVYSILENKPNSGHDWWTEVVLPLAAKYDISPPKSTLSLEESFIYDLKRIYAQVADLINHDIEKMGKDSGDYVRNHNWTEDTLNSFDIGTLEYSKLVDVFSIDELRRFGLERPDLFENNNLLYSSKDQYGRIIRFFARRPNRDPKMDSTASRKLTVNLWSGAGHLYNINRLNTKLPYVIIVEGQSDVVTLAQNKIENVVGTCGCHQFSQEHFNSLVLRGISEFIFVYDNDKAGISAIHDLLKKDFIQSSTSQIKIVTLPEECDPDEYVRKYGPEPFKALIQNGALSAFEYLLNSFTNKEVETVCTQVLPFIAANKSSISREFMALTLSEFLEGKISVNAILGDVNRLDKWAQTKILEAQQAIVKSVSSLAHDNPSIAIEVYREAVDRLEKVDKDESQDSVWNDGLTRLSDTKIEGETGTGGPFNLKRLWNLSDVLHKGSWKSATFMALGAVENMGKTAFLMNLGYDIVSNDENDAILYIQTLDDSFEEIIWRLGCIIVNDPMFELDMMANPGEYVRQGLHEILDMRNFAYNKLRTLQASRKLLIEGVESGTTIAHALKRLRHLRKEFPNKNIVWILDNFHNVTDWENLEQRVRFTNVSKKIKSFSKQHKITTIVSAEYRKIDAGSPGSNEDLAETRSIKFDARFIGHLWSDAHHKGVNDAFLVHRYQDRLYPRVVLRVGKNKITDFKNSLGFDFYPSSSLFIPVSYDQVLKDVEIRKGELGVNS